MEDNQPTATRETILLVDDNVANLKVGKNALTKDYDVYTATSAAKMFELLRDKYPALILLDIDMPVMNGYEALKRLQADEKAGAIPVIFLTAKADVDSEVESLDMGAVDYIYKPFIPSLLRKRVEVHIKSERRRRMLEEQSAVFEQYSDSLHTIAVENLNAALELQDRILRVVADLVEDRDDVTGGHVSRTQKGVRLMVEALRDSGVYTEITAGWDYDAVVRSSQLHDVGKIHIPDDILKKPSRLTPEEFEIMKQHTVFGVTIVDRMAEGGVEIPYLKHARVFAAAHHEKWDGSGYPYGLAGDDIPLEGRIMSFADVYDALVSVRPYKKSFDHQTAVNIILEGRGTHFDPVLVDVFEKISASFRDISAD